jgi:hypothetical protein
MTCEGACSNMSTLGTAPQSLAELHSLWEPASCAFLVVSAFVVPTMRLALGMLVAILLSWA